MKVLVKDTVIVTAGKDKGKQGSVKRILADKNKVVVEGINMVTKHIKGQEGKPGRKIEVAAPIDASNLKVVCPKTKKPSRVGYIVSDSGEKHRIAKVSGEILPNNSMKK